MDSFWSVFLYVFWVFAFASMVALSAIGISV